MRSKYFVVLSSFICALFVACDERPHLTSSGDEFVVRVVSDFAPGVETDRVEVELFEGASTESERRRIELADRTLVRGDLLADGLEVLTRSALASGTYAARAALRKPNGEILGQRTVVFDARSSQIVTIVISAACEGVVCADGSRIECAAGVCVDPRCSDSTPELCPDNAVCEDDADCASQASMCSTARCVAGSCVDVPKPSGCDETEYCAREAGCAPIDMPTMPTGPDPRCGTVCAVDGLPCWYGYYACEGDAVVCTPFVARPVGAPCGNGNVCDDTRECEPAPDASIADAGADASSVDASMALDMGAPPRDASVDMTTPPRDAGVDMATPPRDASLPDVGIDASPDLGAPRVGNVVFDRSRVVVTEFGENVVELRVRLSIPTTDPDMMVYVYVDDRSEATITNSLGGDVGNNSLYFDDENWNDEQVVRIRGTDDDLDDDDQTQELRMGIYTTDTAFLHSGRTWGSLGPVDVDIVTVDDEGPERLDSHFTDETPVSANIGNGPEWSLSSSGRYVAFVAASDGCSANVAVRDRHDHSVDVVRPTFDGACPNAPIYSYLSVSDDGRWVYFGTEASNLVADDTNNASDAFLVDMETGTVKRLMGLGGAEINAWTTVDGRTSDDGEYVAILSGGTNLTSNPDENDSGDVFLYSRSTDSFTLLSRTSEGRTAGSFSQQGAVDPSGKKVAFYSSASNIEGAGTNGIFVYDIASDSIEQAVYPFSNQPFAIGRNVTYLALSYFGFGWRDPAGVYSGAIGSGYSTYASIKPDGTDASYFAYAVAIDDAGRFVMFSSDTDMSGTVELYVRDTADETSYLLDDDARYGGWIASDGSSIAFQDNGITVVPTDYYAIP